MTHLISLDLAERAATFSLSLAIALQVLANWGMVMTMIQTPANFHILAPDKAATRIWSGLA